ncbi:MAG: uroporphyrinogen-III synthase [bacterium]|nr:uroporphyrinogen-III synthase [bacterium]
MPKLLIYRDREQSEQSAKFFTKLNFEILIEPLIRYEGHPFQLSDLHRDCEHILIPSLNAARFFFENSDMFDFCQSREIHCVGEKFAKSFEADFSPIQTHQYFLEAIRRLAEMNCRTVLYPCKQGLASKRQEEALAEGVSLRPVMCYEQFQDEGNKKFQEILNNESQLVILSLSESQAQLLNAYNYGNHKVACLGDRTATHLKKLGVSPSQLIIAEKPNLESLADAIKKAFS